MRSLLRAAGPIVLISLLLAGCQTAAPRHLAASAVNAVPAAVPPAPAPPAPVPGTPDASSPDDAGPPSVATSANADGQSPPRESAVAAERSGADVFAHLRARLDASSCAVTSLRNPWYRRYLRHPEPLARQLAGALPLLDFVDREVEARSLPAEFVLMPLIESGYRPGAMGVGGPAGLWQMISSTARNHGVQVTTGYDGRLSPLDSTGAALSYLSTLQPMFDSWQAVAMAYNAGENRMRRALASSGPRVSALDQRPRGLSAVTYSYVAKLEALACILSDPPASLALPTGVLFEPLLPVRIPDGLGDIEALSAAAGISAGELRRLNPGYRRKRIDTGTERWLLLPVHAGARLTAPDALAMTAPVPATAEADDRSYPGRPAQEQSKGVPDSITTHEVKAGDTLWSIARRYGLRLEALLRINGLRRESPLRPGQTLRLSP